ncbi:MAG: class I SAM-dependent methyltransferase [Kastovskya adunca ATA6-11-RM4]|jgi:cyclopropane fatty-acyl-phospholipid synthase-like methyltransferase|nr:class I SAM-dependent methyltransferase [Kastovskya adunca ATA6-11-RM4]
MNKPRQFPDWKQIYQDREVETMPWFNPDLDADLERALTDLNLNAGTVLDLGTGPGTQAIALAERGFSVTASDISEAAIARAEGIGKEQGLDVTWKQDDILNSTLNQQFDFVFDRGCFHVFSPEQRQNYLRTLNNLVKPKGYFFLKCFSHLQPGEEGPYRFTPEEIRDIFTPHFNIHSIKETVYQGTLDPLPQALFSVLEKH